MEMTVGKMKVGDKLVFGQYASHVSGAAPIVWLKATSNGDFITESVLDYICFDARERRGDTYTVRMYGNPDYECSNIVLYLNREDEDWWAPTHSTDAPPVGAEVFEYQNAYRERCGFLNYFEDYELDSLTREAYTVNGVRLQSLMRLPSFSDIVGENKFQLFSRKGIRAHGSSEYIYGRGSQAGFDSGSFIEYWLSDLHAHEYPAILGRSGYMEYRLPYKAAGLRPVCTIKLDTVVDGDGTLFRVSPFGVQNKLFTDDEFFDLLGVVRP